MMSVPILLVSLLSLEIKALSTVSAAVLTLQNSCPYTVWPAATLSSGDAINPNSSVLGFSDIPSNSRASLSVPPGWSGRIWARTGCLSTSSRAAACTTGDSPPFTLAEFTLSTQHDHDDLYDVSLVQGYNVGIGVTASSEGCKYAGCTGDMNAKCPAELRVEGGADGETVACKTPCQVFGAEEYCCTGKHSKRETCGQTRYSQLFKSACPNAYTYVYDDDAFTCAAGADYLVTFCPVVAAA